MSLKNSLCVLAGLVALSALMPSAYAGPKWACMKDGATVKVKGKSADEKKADCTAQSGTWEEKKHAEGKEEKSGKGGGW